MRLRAAARRAYCLLVGLEVQPTGCGREDDEGQTDGQRVTVRQMQDVSGRLVTEFFERSKQELDTGSFSTMKPQMT